MARGENMADGRAAGAAAETGRDVPAGGTHEGRAADAADIPAHADGEAPAPRVEFHDSIGSTNTRCKELARAGAPGKTLVVAARQTGGRGRQGRAFSSPCGSGAYFSLLLRNARPLDAGLLSARAALAVCAAAEDLGARAGAPLACEVKWPNDVYCRRKKVAGILIEGGVNGKAGDGAGGNGTGDAPEGNAARAGSQAGERAGGWWYVVGIGINVYAPHGGWPSELARAGALLERGQELPAGASAHATTPLEGIRMKANGEGGDIARARAFLVGRICDVLAGGPSPAGGAPAPAPDRAHVLEAYSARNMLAGQCVEAECGNERFRAAVEGIDDDFSLRVRAADGEVRRLRSGEVHLHLEGAGARPKR